MDCVHVYNSPNITKLGIENIYGTARIYSISREINVFANSVRHINVWSVPQNVT